MSDKVTKEEAANALEQLRKLCPPGGTVYTILRSVSRSGMCRHIDCYVISDGKPRWITGYMYLMQRKHVPDYKGMRVSGAGMDMGAHLVRELSYRLHKRDEDSLRQEWL